MADIDNNFPLILKAELNSFYPKTKFESECFLAIFFILNTKVEIIDNKVSFLIQTDNLKFIKLASLLLKKIDGVTSEIVEKKIKEKLVYELDNISSPETILLKYEIVDDFHNPNIGLPKSYKSLSKQGLVWYITALLLTLYNDSFPNIELHGFSHVESDSYLGLFYSFGINPAIKKTGKNFNLSIDDANDIVYLLDVIGANKSKKYYLAYLANESNMSTENDKNDISAETIKKRFDTIDKSAVSKYLLKAAEMRIQYPKLSLGDIANLYSPSISRSTYITRLKSFIKL
jgi:DNA-binding protein WhiA